MYFEEFSFRFEHVPGLRTPTENFGWFRHQLLWSTWPRYELLIQTVMVTGPALFVTASVKGAARPRLPIAGYVTKT